MNEKTTAGYSGTPLAKKLGLKAGMAVLTVDAPDAHEEMIAPLPADVTVTAVDSGMTGVPSDAPPFDMVHLFTNTRDGLLAGLVKAMGLIRQDGMIWVSWYKKSAKLPTEIIENTVRDAALPLGLVDVKVCAVDDRWSGLKLVIRRENRV